MQVVTRNKNWSLDQLGELLERIYEKDSEAWELLSNWCIERVYHKIKMELACFEKTDWDEVAQETMTDLHRCFRAKRIDASADKLPMLINGFVKNEIAEFLSRRKKRISREERPAKDLEQIIDTTLAEEWKFDFHTINEKTARLESLFEICLEKLRKTNAERAEVLRLRYWGGLKLREIAEELGLPNEQKAIDLHRQAKKDLERCLKRYL